MYWVSFMNGKGPKKRSSKEDHRVPQKLVNYKDLERNVLNEIAKEFADPKDSKNTK